MNVSPIGSGKITSPNWSVNPTSYPAIYTCSQTYVLTAVPNNTAGYHFDRWGGDYPGSTNPLTVSVSDGVKSVTAYFVLLTDDVAAPSSLTAKAISSTQISLGWKDNSNNETGFMIEKKPGNCDSTNEWAQLTSKPANATTHTLSGLTPNTTYSFRIRAYNASANSTYSSCASEKTGASGTPPAPSDFKATAVSSTKVNLTWKDNSTNETGLKIYRKTVPGTWALLTTTGDNIKSFSDNTAMNNSSTTTYQYYISSYNVSGASPSTSTALVPYQPINLTASQSTTAGSIKLTWTDKSSNETGIEIYRKSGNCSSTSTWSKVATLGANKTTWTDSGRTTGSSFSYKIRSYTKSGSVLSAYGYSMWTPCKSVVAP